MRGKPSQTGLQGKKGTAMQLNVTVEITDSLADKAKKIPNISSFVSRTFLEALRRETDSH